MTNNNREMMFGMSSLGWMFIWVLEDKQLWCPIYAPQGFRKGKEGRKVCESFETQISNIKSPNGRVLAIKVKICLKKF